MNKEYVELTKKKYENLINKVDLFTV